MSVSQSEESSYQSLVELLDAGEIEACISGCMSHLEEFGDSAKIWILTGSAFGASDKPNQARTALLCALKIDSNDENAQVNYVTSCLHGGYKSDAIKSLDEFLPDMSDECLAFKMAPSLAEALELGVLLSTDISPRIWIRIENILDSVEHDLDSVDEEDVLELENDFESRDNVIQFPIRNPDFKASAVKPHPVAHFIMEGGHYKTATLYIEQDSFLVKGFEDYIASPCDYDDPRGEWMTIENPRDLAEFLFSDSLPESISFLKLARRDWERNGSDFYLFDGHSDLDKSFNGKHLIHGHGFEKNNRHFKQEAVWNVNMNDVLYPFSATSNYQAYQRLDEIWSPPYLGEIIFKELKKELSRIKRSMKKVS